MSDKPYPIIETSDIKSVIEVIERIPNNELTYEKILLLSECYYRLVTKDYDGSSPLREHEQEKLIHAARLMKTVEKQGYDDYRWCGLLTIPVFFMLRRSLNTHPHLTDCNCASSPTISSFVLVKSILTIEKDF